MFMCSDLYIAAFNGRTTEVIGLLTGSNQRRRETAGQLRPREQMPFILDHAAAPVKSPPTAARSSTSPLARGTSPSSPSSATVTAPSSPRLTRRSTPRCTARRGLAMRTPWKPWSGWPWITWRRTCYVDSSAAKTGLGTPRCTWPRGTPRCGGRDADEADARVSVGAKRRRRVAAVPAVMSRSVQPVAAIVEYRDASAAGPNSQNALQPAVLHSSEMVSLLLRWQPALATDLDANKSSPLHYASSDGDVP